MPFVVKAGPMEPDHFHGMNEIGHAGLIVENLGHEGDWNQLSLRFTEPRGYGKRCFNIEVGWDEFKNLAEAMIRTDRTAAIKAFGAALQMDASERIERGRAWRPEYRPKAA